MTPLNLTPEFLTDPDQVDVAAVEAAMWWHDDDRQGQRIESMLRLELLGKSHQLPTDPETLAALFENARLTPAREDIQPELDRRCEGGLIAGFVCFRALQLDSV